MQSSSSSKSENSGTARSVSGLQPIETPRFGFWEVPAAFHKFARSGNSTQRSRCPFYTIFILGNHSSERAKFARAIGARANHAEVIVTVNPRGVSVVESNVDRVVADGMRRAGHHFRFEHRKHGGCGRRGTSGCKRLFSR